MTSLTFRTSLFRARDSARRFVSRHPRNRKHGRATLGARDRDPRHFHSRAFGARVRSEVPSEYRTACHVPRTASRRGSGGRLGSARLARNRSGTSRAGFGSDARWVASPPVRFAAASGRGATRARKRGTRVICGRVAEVSGSLRRRTRAGLAATQLAAKIAPSSLFPPTRGRTVATTRTPPSSLLGPERC